MGYDHRIHPFRNRYLTEVGHFGQRVETEISEKH
jgi:hypothetical protein